MNIEDREIIQAAGGLVENEKGEVLFIFRRNKWDLPKGKLDPGETLETCALREVKEETGIKNVQLVQFLLITNHPYEENGALLIKESHWYRMKSDSREQLVAQTEEDITELRWIAPADFHIVQRNTFPGILQVIQKAGFKLIPV